ncbi:hypothetical protein BY996DRAFT_4577318 [Phakopsora pachyrhizi]|uniref:Expressed protein n=1 Tax=Phakopsora pachyrhizi TaxID=170000 RepID=A0AAV0BEB5_PHAPC|nr:hypothetical protein BY996DRAFT_4577318 [Phakopsora pachyrhizi]CAH7685270.1 expressed protein [Phakopsora pachyrhizi]
MRTPGKVSITQSSQHISPPPMNKIAEFAAQMICYLWFAEPSTLQKSTTSSYTRDQSRFELTLSTERLGSAIDGKINGSSISSGAINQAQLIPNPEFVVFIHNLLSTTQVSHSVVLLALFYIHRLKCLNPIKPNAKSEYRIGAVSLMLANKMLDDHTYTAKTWSEVSRLPLSSLNDGEIEFLQGLNFELHVNMRNFNAWFRLLHGMVHLKDCHTAAALAAGPRTRWFKKMRIVSGEGLSVLEGLVSPIRNSGMMKLEVEKELNKSPLVFATSKSQSRPDSQFMAINSCQTIRGCQPNHPYNLRRSARGHLHAISSNSSATPLTAGWAGGVESNSRSCIASYSAILPSSNPISAATSHEPSRFKDNFDHILSSKSRMLAHPTQSSSKVGFNGKRSYSEVDSADEGDYFNGENPSKRTISWNINETISGATERLPLIAHPQDIQANANYLGNAIMPSSTIINQQACPGAELYFHSLAAGRRATEQPVRQGVTSDNQNLGNEGYILGSQPWQKGIPMDEGCGARRPYSSFSNAGLPGVVWAEGTITGKSNETFQLSNQYSSNHSRLCYLPNNETPFLGYPPSSTLSQPSFRHDCQAQY